MPVMAIATTEHTVEVTEWRGRSDDAAVRARQTRMLALQPDEGVNHGLRHDMGPGEIRAVPS